MASLDDHEIMPRAEARALGLKTYFSGKPCKHGHLALRYVSGGCSVCAKIHDNRKRSPTSGSRKAAVRAARLRFDLKTFPAAGELEYYSRSISAREHSKYLDGLLSGGKPPEEEEKTPVAIVNRPRRPSHQHDRIQKRAR